MDFRVKHIDKKYNYTIAFLPLVFISQPKKSLQVDNCVIYSYQTFKPHQKVEIFVWNENFFSGQPCVFHIKF